MRHTLALLAAVVAAPACAAPGTVPAAAAPLEAGCVVAAEGRAAVIGARVLEQGGNAVDAAVATGFALAVTHPTAGNIGGGGFLLVHHEGETLAVDCRETAPWAATRDMYLGPDGNVVKGRSLHTHLASGVPGSVAGMYEAHRRWGTQPWADLLQPAVDLARDGFTVSERVRRELQRVAARSTTHPSFHVKFFDAIAGKPLVQDDLARTLERIAEGGRDGFYRGRGGGLVTLDDLAAYEVRFRTPVEGTFRGHRVVSMPPPSSGGAILLMMLGMLEEAESIGLYKPGRWTHNSPGYVHLVAEIEKRVFADRAEHFGDPDFHDVPLDALLSRNYLLERVQSIVPTHRTDPSSLGAGDFDGGRESEETTHYSVVDRRGNAVSHTTTLNAGYGSTIVVEGAGFLLNNEMDDFSAKPGVPNLYGAVGGSANAVGPRKRMLSSMSPTLVFDPDGRLRFVLGTPGGTTIFTTVFQVLVARLDHARTLGGAVAAPRFHHQWPPRTKGTDPVRSETGSRALSPDVAAHLRYLGYAFPAPRGTIGRVMAIEVDREYRRAIGVADPRSEGVAAGEKTPAR
ncbi:MAG: gamma-glutamyltransferase [Planctomycetota bacterium]